MPYRPRLAAFASGTGRLAFECIKSRADFAHALGERAGQAGYIRQSNTPLCGPAAFMFCVAREKPADYVSYVLDLATTGKGDLGGLTVKPSASCLKASASDSKGREIDPVDWVALAGLRDSTNAVHSVNVLDDNVAGMTIGSTIAEWFRKTGWFAGGASDNSSIVSCSSVNNLLQINALGVARGPICMAINAAILQGNHRTRNKFGKENSPKKMWGGMNHWIVLLSNITVGTRTPGPGAIANDAFLDQRIDFSFYSWGDPAPRRPTPGASPTVKTLSTCGTGCYPSITLRQFLPYYHGFVNAVR